MGHEHAVVPAHAHLPGGERRRIRLSATASNNSPPRYLDTLPAVYNVGPGSPTGMTFGYGAPLPAKYRSRCSCADWSYGKLYALHLTPRAALQGGAGGVPQRWRPCRDRRGP